jgi:hypothetical protein
MIDTLVRPVIQSDPELLATWDNIVALPRSPRSSAAAVATPVASSIPTTPVVVKDEATQGEKAAA